MDYSKEYLLKIKTKIEELINSTDIVDIHMDLAELKQELADEIGPVLDNELCFTYKGFNCELTSCNNIMRKSQMLGLTEENFLERFPNGVFSDRYVCWLSSHVNDEGHTKEECDDPDDWVPMLYLVPDAWSWGAEYDLAPGSPVDTSVLFGISKFLKEHPEIK